MLQQPGQTGDAGGEGSGEGSMEFPVTNLYELDSRVFQVNSYLKKRFVLIVNVPFSGQLEHPVQAGGEPWQVSRRRHQARC